MAPFKFFNVNFFAGVMDLWMSVSALQRICSDLIWRHGARASAVRKESCSKSAPNLLNMKAFSCAVDSYEHSVGFFLSISFHTPHIGLVFGLCGSTCGLPYGAEKMSCMGRSRTWNIFLSCVFSHELSVHFYLGIFFHTSYSAWASQLHEDSAYATSGQLSDRKWPGKVCIGRQAHHLCELFCALSNCYSG